MRIIEIIKKEISKRPFALQVSSFAVRTLFNNFYLKHGKNNRILCKNSFLINCKIKVHGNNNIININDKTFMKSCKIEIYGNNNRVSISEKNCQYFVEYHIEDSDNQISIGKNGLLFGKIHLACIESTQINIGDECLFSSDIIFRTGDSHSILDSLGQRINPSSNIDIGNHVWIGNGVTVTKGASIRDDTVIGTKSLVNKKFDENNIIIAGVPANVIKSNISWDKQRL